MQNKKSQESKLADITAVYKKDNRNDKENYKPKSI